jgi:hypothetical protein
MSGVFEFLIYPNFEIFKFKTISNSEYQLLIFKKRRHFTDFKNQEFKYFKNINCRQKTISRFQKRDSKNVNVIRFESSKFENSDSQNCNTVYNRTVVIIHITPAMALASDTVPTLATRFQHLTCLLVYHANHSTYPITVLPQLPWQP